MTRDGDRPSVFVLPPIEIAVLTANGVERLYPIFDEAAAGIPQAVVDERGNIVSRSVIEGAYGEDEFVLSGSAVDRISVTAARDTDGVVTSVTIEVRLTEALDASTVATGARLAAVDTDGAAVHTVTVQTGTGLRISNSKVNRRRRAG